MTEGAGPAETPPNPLYDLLFCDDPDAFRPQAGQSQAGWQSALFAEPPDLRALAALAGDEASDARARYLAFGRLRALGAPVPASLLLGVVVEVALDDGLDVLAAYADGGVRLLHHRAGPSILEGVESLRAPVESLLAASRSAAARIGPWQGPRRPPPAPGNVRLTFLGSGGICFGEAPMAALQRDPWGAPVLAAATALLQATIAILRAGRG